MEENKMGVMPVNKLLISMALPMMISMLVQALYNIVDSMFVAQISENALTAVSLAFPAQNLMIAIGTGTGVPLLRGKKPGACQFDCQQRLGVICHQRDSLCDFRSAGQQSFLPCANR